MLAECSADTLMKDVKEKVVEFLGSEVSLNFLKNLDHLVTIFLPLDFIVT